MQTIQYDIRHDDNDWWILCADEYGPYEDILLHASTIKDIDANAKGFLWSLHYRKKGQRKDRVCSIKGRSFTALLDNAKGLLDEGGLACVYMLTPDVRINVY